METHKIYIAPSILSADLLLLKTQVEMLADNGADFIHLDVMDGHFVPNLTFGPNMVEVLKQITSLPLDVHLMISNPDLYIKDYAQAGADILTVHQEACTHLHRILQSIHQQGIKAGVSLNPATPLATIENVLDNMDLLLIMTVNPGFGGQKFIPQGLKKIAEARRMIDTSGRDILLEVDGGVDSTTVESIVQHGARVLVSGSAIFGQKDIVAAMLQLKEKAEKV